MNGKILQRKPSRGTRPIAVLLKIAALTLHRNRRAHDNLSENEKGPASLLALLQSGALKGGPETTTSVRDSDGYRHRRHSRGRSRHRRPHAAPAAGLR